MDILFTTVYSSNIGLRLKGLHPDKLEQFMNFFKFIIISLLSPIFIHSMNTMEPYTKSTQWKEKHSFPVQFTQPHVYPTPAPIIEKRYQSNSIFTAIVKEALQDCGMDEREQNNLSTLDNQIATMSDDQKNDPATYGTTLSQLYVGNDATTIKYMLAHTIIDATNQKSKIDELEPENKLLTMRLETEQKKSRFYQNLIIVGCATVGYILSKDIQNPKLKI